MLNAVDGTDMFLGMLKAFASWAEGDINFARVGDSPVST